MTSLRFRLNPKARKVVMAVTRGDITTGGDEIRELRGLA
jgi:hypothetical protein